MTLYITALPPELLEIICSFLEPNDFKNFGLTCKLFYDVISSDTLWQKMIAHKYGIEVHQYSASTARAFYQQILLAYAPILGLWLMEFNQYGGLLRVFVEDGCIIGEEIFSPVLEDEILEPVTKKNIFKIHPETSDESSTTTGAPAAGTPPSSVCLLGVDERPSVACDGDNAFLIFHTAADDRLNIRCLNRTIHQERCLVAQEIIWTKGTKDIIGWTRGYQRWMANHSSCECERIQLPTQRPLSLLPEFPYLPEPGLFKGTYGSHGNELILVRYRDEEDSSSPSSFPPSSSPNSSHSSASSRCIIEGFKVTGDPNIPKQKVTFYAYLEEPLYPDKSQQLSMESLKFLELESPVDDSDGTRSRFDKQRFYVPNDLEFDLKEDLLPKFSLGRFRAHCQVAGHGYRGPSFIAAQLIFFDQNLMGLIIFELKNLMVLHRVEL